MYLYIFEDGEIKKSGAIPCGDDLQNVDNGILDIIDISDPRNPLQYYNGDWHDLESAE